MGEESDDPVLNEGTMSIVDPTHPTQHPPNTSGWVNLRHINYSEEVQDESWSLRWLVIESGFLFWYLNDMMGAPEGFKQVKGLDIQYEESDSDLIIVRLSDHNESHHIELSKSNLCIWRSSISQNEKIDTQVAALSLADYRMEDVDTALPASMQIHLKGSPHTLSVGPNDDTSRLTEDFVLQHKLKSDIKPRIESELLRTQVDSCLAFQHKLRVQVAHLRRLVIKSSIYEPRALAAEALSARTFDELKGLSQLGAGLANKMQKLRAESEEKDQKIIALSSDLLQEQIAAEQYQEASVSQLETCQTEIELLQKQLRAQKFKNRDDSKEGMVEDSVDPSILQDAIEEIETKNAQLDRQECRINALLRNNGEVTAEKEEAVRALGECTESNTALQDLLQQKTLLERKLVEDLRHNKRMYDEEITSLQQQLADAVDKANEAISSQQKLESKVKKLSEDNKRAATGNQALAQKHELASLGFDASRQENRALQDQLRSAELQLTDFKNNTSVKLIRSLNEENGVLKEQSVRLRGEVLSLQAKIDEIESSAFSAVQSMKLLTSEVGDHPRSPLAPLHASQLAPNDREGEVTVELIVEDEDLSASDFQSRKSSSDEVVYDEETDTDVEVDFGLEHVLTAASKEEEKSVAALSPIVEDRLLRNIYGKYTTETSELLTLTRFGRFTKEFKIAGLVKSFDRSNLKGAKKVEAMLVYGDVDVVFMNTVKSVPVDDNDPLAFANGSAASPRGLRSPQQASFNPGGGNVRSLRTTSATQIKGSHLSANQFIAAVQDLAVRLYSSVIEEKTGTVLDCLPEKQKKIATRATMDVMVVKKLMPHASKLGLVPWELMFLDQTLTTIHSSDIASHSLVMHVDKVSAWFMHYSKVVEISLFSSPEKSRQSMSASVTSPSYSRGSLSVGANGRSPFGKSKGHLIEAPEIFSFRGMSYKSLSKFFHDYGVIPYLLKDPQLFSMFSEVNAWSKGNAELLLTALPQEVRELPAVGLELSNPPDISAKLARKKYLLCGSFFILFSAIANQAFDEIPPEKRITRLFEWTAQSGGSYLMQKRM